MVRRRRWRWLFPAFALAGAVGLGALQSVVWHGPDAPPWARAVASVVSPRLADAPSASAQPVPPAVYFTLGRGAVAVYALLLAGVAGLRGQVGRGAARALGGVLAVALAGDVLAYWLSEAFGPALRRVGFWYLEVPALALAVLGCGAHGLRAPHRRLLWTLPATAAATALLRYWPHALLAGLATGFLALALAPQAEPASLAAAATVASPRPETEAR